MGRRYVVGISSAEARGATKYPAMHRTVPIPKNYLAPNVNCAMVRNPALGKGTHSILQELLDLGACGCTQPGRKAHSVQSPAWP